MSQGDRGQWNTCWVDVFEEAAFSGRARRLFGPGEFRRLRVCADTVRGLQGGEIEVKSLAAGPGTYAVCFDDADEAGTAFWILPTRMVSDLDATHMGRRINSLRLLRHPPEANDPAYAAYVRAADSRNYA